MQHHVNPNPTRYAKLYLGDHVLHRTSHLSRTLEPVWNENFEFHGNLKTLLANKLQVQVSDYDIGGKNLGHSHSAAAENDLGSATFDLSDVQTADFEGEARLSVQGSIKLKFSWAPAKVLKKGEMFVKHKGDVVTSMGKYVKNEFTLWYAENNGRSGGSHAAPNPTLTLTLTLTHTLTRTLALALTRRESRGLEVVSDGLRRQKRCAELPYLPGRRERDGRKV